MYIHVITVKPLQNKTVFISLDHVKLCLQACYMKTNLFYKVCTTFLFWRHEKCVKKIKIDNMTRPQVLYFFLKKNIQWVASKSFNAYVSFRNTMYSIFCNWHFFFRQVFCYCWNHFLFLVNGSSTSERSF